MAPGETVCVTGAGGFIASWIVKMLLEKGYNVRGTVRNPENAKYLLELPGASDRLQLFAADLLTPGAFDSIVEGCDGLFHTASPVPGLVEKPNSSEAAYLEPAINGTLNVLESCAKARTERIVLTSSFAAVRASAKYTPESVMDETFFSDPDVIRKTMSGELATYTLSKTYAEKAAWDFVKKNDLNMVVINPVWVTGPSLHSSVSPTNAIPLHFLTGAKTIPNEVNAWIGVKDVAKAHILAYEKPEAEGRYLISDRVMHLGDFVALLQRLFPQYPIVAREDALRVPTYKISTKRMKELGIDADPLEDVLRETVECFKKFKHLD